MDRFLQLAGLIGAAAIFIVAAIYIVNMGGGSFTAIAMIGALQWAMPALVGCILIAAFGSLIGVLKGIRDASERQAATFQAILDTKRSK
jgi:hypothetical protein